MIQEIATVAIYVEDQERARAFWTDKIGFHVRKNIQMGPNAHWLEVAPSAAQSCLVLYPKAMMTNWEELKPSIVFQCNDLVPFVEKIKARGVEITQEPTKMPWGLYAKFKDPDGNEFLLKS